MAQEETMQFFDGKLRIAIHSGSVDFRVIAETDEDGAEEAFKKIDLLVQDVQQKKVIHETHERKHGDGHRIDAVVIKTHIDRRKGKQVHHATDRRTATPVSGLPTHGNRIM